MIDIQILYMAGTIISTIILIPCVIVLIVSASKAAMPIRMEQNFTEDEDEIEFDSLPQWEVNRIVANVHKNDRHRKGRGYIL